MSGNSLYRVYSERKQELAEVTNRQLKVIEELGLDDFFKAGSKPGEQLSELAMRLKTENLRMLVMGEFSSGKSTFLNSMLGARILPDSVLPTTAVITEIRYSDESGKKIVLYPRPGKWQKGDAPFSIGLDEFQKYTSIHHKDGFAEPSPFQRAEVWWPLAFCRDQVEVVDSPGLNDPDNNDEITLTYAPSADAIIYCMSCERAYTKLDSLTINTLRSQGYTSILFVLTKYDRVLEAALLKGSREDEDFRRVMLEKLVDKTDLGKPGIFFVDSLHGLLARIKGNQEALASTGVPEVENKIESYVVQQKGRAKLLKAVYLLRSANLLAEQSLKEKEALSSISLQDLEKMYAEVETPLKHLTTRGGLICAQVDSGLKDTLSDVQRAARAFVITCPDKIPKWLEDYKSETAISLNPLKMKATVKAVADDYINHIKVRMKEDSASWGEKSLVPLITGSVQALFQKLNHETNAYNAQLSAIRVSLMFDPASDAEQIATQGQPSTASRLGSIILGLPLLGAVGVVSGAVFGWEGLLRTATAQIAAVIVLYVAWLFTPVGPVASAIVIVVASIIGAASTADKLAENIRKKVVTACQEALRNPKQQEKMVTGIMESVRKELNTISEQVRAALDEDIDKLKGEVEAAIQEKKKDAAEIQRKRQRLVALRKENGEIAQRILDIALDAGMSDMAGGKGTSADCQRASAS